MKLLKRLFCKMKWHSFSYNQIGLSSYGEFQCKWCKYVGLVDSQGNLF